MGDGAWAVTLNGVTLTGGDAATGIACLTAPPDGLGLPPLRTEDVVYPQRDGARHFADWYEPRIITLEDVYVCDDGCPGCPTGRAKVQQIMSAWGRKCGDVELVIFTDCHDPDAAPSGRALTGPYGVVGRPRVAELTWITPSKTGCAALTLRFDAVDHRMFVLDGSGEAGSGTQCVTLGASVDVFCRTYDRCYSPSGMCYDTDISPSGGGPQTLTVGGTLCVRPTITLTGPLTNPRVENVTTGEFVQYNGAIAAGDTVTIDLSTGTAVTDSGASRTHLLTGNTRWLLVVGDNEVRLTAFNPTDTGTAEVCWRDTVDWA